MFLTVEEVIVMKRVTTILICLVFLMGFAGSALAQKLVLLTLDEDKDLPTIVNVTRGAMATYRSVNFVDPAAPESFEMVFSNFVGEWDSTYANGTPCTDNTPGAGDVTCTAVNTNNAGNPCTVNMPPGNNPHACYEVRIKLANPPRAGSQGFSYTVNMSGKVLDPRVRGN